MKKYDIHTHLDHSDPSMDTYVRTMDKHDVEAILCHGWPARDYGLDIDNEDVLRAMKRHAGRIYGSAYVDLRQPVPQCVDEVARYADAGCVCIKVFPNLGFDPNDEAFEPVWQKMEERGLMCLSHCGWLAPCRANPQMRIQSLTATPLHFEVPARRHPGINFIFAHFGGGFSYLETVTLLSRLPNCYADVCPGWGKWVWQNRMPGLEGLDMSRILFGTDSAGERYAEDEAFWTYTFRSYGRSKAEIQDFFYGNAARLLGRADGTSGAGAAVTPR